MKNQRTFLIISVLALASLVCSLPIPGMGSGGGQEISDEERTQALEDLGAFTDSLMGTNDDFDRQALAEHIESLPEFEAAGIAPDGSVWGRFNDGRPVIFPVYFVPAPDIDPMETPSSVNPLLSEDKSDVTKNVNVQLKSLHSDLKSKGTSGGLLSMPAFQSQGDYELPESDLAFVMNALGNSYGAVSTYVAVSLGSFGKYRNSDESKPTVENLKAVKNAGVFFIFTHGGAGCMKGKCDQGGEERGEFGGWFYSLWTATKQSDEKDKFYKDELDKIRLVYMYAQFETKDDPETLEVEGKPEWHYAITEDFILEHMSFSKNSLVFVQACSSMYTDIELGFKEKGAAFYAGWTRPTYNHLAPRYFFDRLTGTNLFEKINPPNRPFDYKTVFETMKNDPTLSTATTGEYGLSVLEFDSFHGESGILIPSIKYMEVNEEKKELTLHGMFGSKAGEISIGGQQVKLKGDWDAEKLVVELPPAKSAGGKGDVVVTVGRHASNKAPLTLWHVKFKYTEGPEDIIGGYHWLDLDIYWRADVHKFREKPDDDVPLAQSTIKLEPADDSSAKWSCEFDGYFGEIKFSTESGEGELPFTREEGKYGFSSTATLEINDRQMKNLQFLVNYDPETTCMVRTTGPGADITSALGFVALPSALENVFDHPALEPLKFTEKYKLVGEENRDVLGLGSWPYLKWEDTEAESPPEYENQEKLTPG